MLRLCCAYTVTLPTIYLPYTYRTPTIYLPWQLFCVNPLLAKQTHADTTIGGNKDFAWLASKTVSLSLSLA